MKSSSNTSYYCLIILYFFIYFFYISSVAFISYLQIINLNRAGEGRRGQQSNLTHGGCEHCVYTPKLVVCKWVWSWLTALENSSRSGHRHFPEGSPRRHQDIFMIHPLTTPPPQSATAVLTAWTRAYVDATFSKRYLGFIREVSAGDPAIMARPVED